MHRISFAAAPQKHLQCFIRYTTKTPLMHRTVKAPLLYRTLKAPLIYHIVKTPPRRGIGCWGGGLITAIVP